MDRFNLFLVVFSFQFYFHRNRTSQKMSRRLFMHPIVINLSMPSLSNQKIALKKSPNSPKKGLIVNLACDVQNSIWVCIIRVLFQYSRNTWIILKYLVPKTNSVHITRSERQFKIYWGGPVQIQNWILELVKPFPVFMRLIKITLQYNLGKMQSEAKNTQKHAF